MSEYPTAAPTGDPALALWVKEQVSVSLRANEPIDVVLSDIAQRLAVWICDQAEAGFEGFDFEANGLEGGIGEWLRSVADLIDEVADPSD